jgi:hypothetical protein
MAHAGTHTWLKPLRAAVAAMVITASFFGCGSGRPDPRGTVVDMFTAIRNSDSLYLASHIDLERAAGSVRDDLRAAGGDTLGAPPAPGRLLLSALVGDGTLRRRWLEDQIVLGESQVVGDTGYVEVSFLDRLTRVQYYNKMRLAWRTDHWVVLDFRTM